MRLICFGDSWTAGHGIENNIEYKEIANPPTFVEKLRTQNSWPRWVANKLGEIEFVNMGVCGYGNEYIFREIESAIKNNFIEKTDIVIVMFSYPYRYTADTYTVIEVYNKIENILSDYKHFYLNSFFPTFKYETEINTNELPSFFINPNGTVSDILKEYELNNNISVWEHNSRLVWNDEQNFYEGDYHPNLLGYKIIGQYIYNSIVDKI
jgi:hypothetical protein